MHHEDHKKNYGKNLILKWENIFKYIFKYILYNQK